MKSALAQSHRFIDKVLEAAETRSPEIDRKFADEYPRVGRRSINRVFATTRRHLPLLHTAYGRVFLLPGYQRLNGGTGSIVLRKGAEVFKIDRASIGTASHTLDKVTTGYRQRHTIMRKYLADFLINQSTNTELLPFRWNARGCVTHQEFVLAVVPDLLNTDLETLRKAIQDSGLSPHVIAEQIDRFCEKSRQLFAEVGYQVDLVGSGNLVITTDCKLLLLDTSPIEQTELQQASQWSEFKTVHQEHLAAFTRLQLLTKTLASKHERA